MTVKHNLDYKPIVPTKENVQQEQVMKLTNPSIVDAKKQQNIQNLTAGLPVQH